VVTYDRPQKPVDTRRDQAHGLIMLDTSLTAATCAARPAAIAAGTPVRRARRPRFASVTAFIRAMVQGVAAMDPIDRLMAQASTEQTAEYVRMALLSRSIDGDAWATAVLGGQLPAARTTDVAAVAMAQAAAYRAGR
jgi:hypothetical protein